MINLPNVVDQIRIHSEADQYILWRVDQALSRSEPALQYPENHLLSKPINHKTHKWALVLHMDQTLVLL